jgi:hypothetical protein
MDLDRNGTVLWKYVFESKPNHYYLLSDHPFVDDDNTSYFSVLEYVESSHVGDNNSVIPIVNSYSDVCAVSSDGELKWKRTFDFIDKSTTFAADKSGSLIYVLTNGNRLYALNKDGIESWNLTMTSIYGLGGIHGMSISPEGTIYVAYDYSIWAVDPQGRPSWNRTLPGWIGQGIGIGDLGQVYVYVNSDLYAFDANGTQLWKVESGDSFFSPIIVDKAGTVIYGTNGIVHAVDRNGSMLWSYDAGGYVISTVPGCQEKIVYSYHQ